MGSPLWQVVRIGPKVGDLGNPSTVIKFEKAQPRLQRPIRVRELDPASGEAILADYADDLEMPVSWEPFDVEPEVGAAPADSLTSLGALVDNFLRHEIGGCGPISGVGCSAVGSNDLARRAHHCDGSRWDAAEVCPELRQVSGLRGRHSAGSRAFSRPPRCGPSGHSVDRRASPRALAAGRDRSRGAI